MSIAARFAGSASHPPKFLGFAGSASHPPNFLGFAGLMPGGGEGVAGEEVCVGAVNF